MKISRIAFAVLVGTIATSLGAGSADAGVKGREFAGFQIAIQRFPGVCTLSFDANGELTVWEKGVGYGGSGAGPYVEREIFGLTSWQAKVEDNSPNGTATITGFCLFGLITSYHNQNLDQGVTADGLLIFTGFVPSDGEAP